MKTTLKVLALFFTVCATVRAQVVPAATGPGSLPVSNKLNYALRYAQAAQFGGGLPDWQTSTISGSIELATGNQRLPFNLDYTGDYTWTLTGPAYETGYYQRLFLSQGVELHRWKFLLSNDVSYLPQAPTTGFLGIPGTGESIGTTSPAPSSANQSILTLNTRTVENHAAGQLDRALSHGTSLRVGGSSDLLRYPNGDGINTNTVTGNAQLIRQLNARNSLEGSYHFTEFSFPGYTVTFETNTALFGFQRRWSRNLSTDISVGPQWIRASGTSAVPPSSSIVANASINYQVKSTSASVGYNRETNGGAGYLLGGEYDTIAGNLSRDFGVNLTIGLTGGYQRTSGLGTTGVTNGEFGGAQATWRISRNIIAFANYTGTQQSSNAALPPNTLNQLLQIIGFGVGYSPRELHRRQ